MNIESALHEGICIESTARLHEIDGAQLRLSSLSLPKDFRRNRIGGMF